MSLVRVLILTVMLAAAAAVAGATPRPFTITLESFSPYYEPPRASVAVGSPVVWVNPTASYHTIRHDGCVDGSFCAFNSGSVPPNGRFTLDHLPAGEYTYHCELHPIMRGLLVVTAHPGSSES
jgi:plastocyanin